MIVKSKLSLLIFCICSSFSFLSVDSFHEYYVSVTRIEYVEEKTSLQIISQIFIDDFEKLIRERYDDKVVLAVKNEDPLVETYMNRYLSQKLKIEVNTKEVSFKFIGKEYKDDIVYCYLEILGIDKISTMVITNDILYDIYKEQQNIVRTKIYNNNKSFILIDGNNKGVLNFKN